MGLTTFGRSSAEYYWNPSAAGDQFTVPAEESVVVVVIDPTTDLTFSDPFSDSASLLSGQTLILVGQDDSNLPTFIDGNGNVVLNNGPAVLGRYDTLTLVWSYYIDLIGAWIETSRTTR